ncbi:MAG TPA: processed acidic surface protein [Niallia sp.]|nr:processed acidic surface protein [Niallia sp.]
MRKKVSYSLLLLTLILTFATITPVKAAPTQEEVENLADKLGWTAQDLQRYLNFKGLQVEDFEDIEILEKQLGTPITPTRLDHLLEEYSMSREELDILLAGFHEDVNDYWFIEELEVAIDFYQNHEEAMIQIEEFLQHIGINDQEKQNVYNQLNKLDTTLLSQQVHKWKGQFAELQDIDSESKLNEDQKRTLVNFWDDYFRITSIKPVFTLIDDNGKRKSTSISSLMSEPIVDTLAIELFDEKDNFIGDAIVTADMLSTPFTVETADKFVDMASMSEQLSTLYAAQMPNTASYLPLLVCMGYLLILIGIYFTFRKKSYAKK